MKRHLAAFIMALMAIAGCEKGPEGSENNQENAEAPKRTSYTNPVSAQSLPDPTVIRGEDGRFWLYATEDIRNMPIMVSHNLIDWKQEGTVFRTGRPNDVAGEMVWAPDITRQDGNYILYYSIAPGDGNQWNYGVGVAIASAPEGPWANRGKLFLGGEVGVKMSIDPFFFEDGGKKYIVWGSYFGLWAIELEPNGLALKKDAKKVRLVGLDGYGVEAPMIHKRDGYYYFFSSEGGSGYDNDYKIGVVRAENFLGPYYNKKGGNATTGAPLTFIMKSNAEFQSPGHCSGIITDDNGTDWILYHSYYGSPDGRRLMLDKIIWGSDGWPTINDGHGPTCKSSEVPYFKD